MSELARSRVPVRRRSRRNRSEWESSPSRGMWLMRQTPSGKRGSYRSRSRWPGRADPRDDDRAIGAGDSEIAGDCADDVQAQAEPWITTAEPCEAAAPVSHCYRRRAGVGAFHLDFDCPSLAFRVGVADDVGHQLGDDKRDVGAVEVGTLARDQSDDVAAESRNSGGLSIKACPPTLPTH